MFSDFFWISGSGFVSVFVRGCDKCSVADVPEYGTFMQSMKLCLVKTGAVLVLPRVEGFALCLGRVEAWNLVPESAKFAIKIRHRLALNWAP